MGTPALDAGAGIVKTDTPGTFILASRPAGPDAAAANQAVTPNPVPEQIITATPPPISTNTARGSVNPKLIAAIATPQSLSLKPPPASAPPEADVAAPLVSTTRPPPVTEMATPVYQVMPNTKPFGYSLVNNDVQVDVEVHIDENGVVRQADPLSGRAWQEHNAHRASIDGGQKVAFQACGSGRQESTQHLRNQF